MKLKKEQQKSLSKTLFDCAKIVFAIAVITPLVSAEVALWKVSLAFLTFILFLLIGVILEGGE